MHQARTWMEALGNRLAVVFEVSGGRADRIGAMEGLRAIAVILVFFVHYHSVFATWIPESVPTGVFAYSLRYVGHTGVDLFFILSGYLIYGATLSATFKYGRFMMRRLQRVYPTFLVLLAIYVGLSFLVPGESKLPADTSEAVVYVLANVLLLPGIFDIKPIVTVAWSLSYEVFFYLSVPLLVAAFGLRWRRPRQRIVLLSALSVLLLCLPLVGLGRYLQILMFVAGMLLYELKGWMTAAQDSRAGPVLRRVAALLTVAVLPITYFSFFGAAEGGEPYRYFAFTVRTAWLFLALGFVVGVALTGRGVLARLCGWSPLRWLGNMSYSYYLLHGLVLKAVSMVLLRITGPDTTHPLAFWAVMPAAFAATLAGSAVLYLWVEKPLSLGGASPVSARPPPVAGQLVNRT